VTTEIVTIATVVAAGCLLYAWFRRAGSANENRFRNEILEDAAGWMGPELGAQPAEVVAALRELITQGTRPPLLARLRDIECEVTKLTPSTARRVVVVLLESKTPGQGLVGRIACEMGWDALPDLFREEFIRTGGSVHTFRILAATAETRGAAI
jgi:hypothetical protein